MNVSTLKYLTVLFALIAFSCKSDKVKEIEASSEIDEFEKIYGYWRFVYGYNGDITDTSIVYGLPGGMADTVVQYFSKDSVSLLYFPYNLVDNKSYSKGVDSIYYKDELNRSVSVKYFVDNDTLTLISRISSKTVFSKLYVPFDEEYSRLEKLRFTRTNWKYVQSIWKINSKGEQPEIFKFPNSDCVLPFYLDLREENQDNFRFEKDTLYYSAFDTTWLFRMRGLWLPGGMWNDSTLSVFYYSNEGEEKMTFYRGLTYE